MTIDFVLVLDDAEVFENEDEDDDENEGQRRLLQQIRVIAPEKDVDPAVLRRSESGNYCWNRLTLTATRTTYEKEPSCRRP